MSEKEKTVVSLTTCFKPPLLLFPHDECKNVIYFFQNEHNLAYNKVESKIFFKGSHPRLHCVEHFHEIEEI